MKGNSKKLAVIVVIAAIAMFITVPMASAGPSIPYGINGVYAVTGLSTCGPVGGVNPVSPGIFEGDYTFSPDGTVSISNGFARNIPGLGPTLAVRCTFKYTVTHEGRIEFQYPEGGLEFGMVDEDGNFISFGVSLNMGPSHGVISTDGKTITITCGPPVGPLWQIDSAGNKIPGTDSWCLTSFTGIRIK